MKPLRKLLMAIPDRRIRRWVTLGLVFAASLLIGRAIEIVFDKRTLAGLHSAQLEWIATVQAFTPMGLVNGYVGDLEAVMSGPWIYEPPPDTSRLEALGVALARQREACAAARARQSSTSGCSLQMLGAGVSATTCMVNPATPGCAEHEACLKSNPFGLTSTPAECLGTDLFLVSDFSTDQPLMPLERKSTTHPLLVPVAALVHGASRIAAAGAGAMTVAMLQIGFGLATFLLVSSALSKTREPGFGNGFANLLLGPAAIVALGSVLALLLQIAMLIALYAFSWITGFAAWAAGATGIAGGCWWCFTKVAEKTIESRVAK